MNTTTTTTTNNVPRDVLDSCELTASERADFDYLDWAKLDAGEDSASFFRYRGSVYDIGEFMPASSDDAPWEGMAGDTYFSATVIRFVDDGERVVVGYIYS